MRALTIQLLKDHQNLIADVARKMGEKHHFYDTDDLISFGRAELVKKAHLYDPAQSSFSSFLYTILHNAMYNYIQRQQRMVAYSYTHATLNHEEGTNWMDNIPDERVSDSLPSRCSDLLENCSSDARDVVNICLTVDLNDVFHNWAAHLKLNRVLCKMGWNKQRRQAAINELRTEIVGVW